ncbi:helix-turn-helix domain-containing protein [Alicyclobacillus sp. SO9]|nr:helix-turn-helix domain-containing protein [Alicyclobacillus sp. SO9]
MGESLLSLALLRATDTEVRTTKLTIWEERPLEILLHTVPKRALVWFLDAVQSRVGQPAPVAGSAPYLGVHQLPEELLVSLRGIVEANLNVSEAARDLFIHRNTLIHRLDKLKELTGYDARVFQDAQILWLAYLSIQSGETTTD